MATSEEFHDFPAATPGQAYFDEKQKAGWRLVSITWERDRTTSESTATTEPVPFGLRISEDRQSLEEDRAEKRVLMRIWELIAKDWTLPAIAADLNAAGLRTRRGELWTPSGLFRLLPRLIEAGPAIVKDTEYIARKR